jgi:hypothetical protein
MPLVPMAVWMVTASAQELETRKGLNGNDEA